MDWRIVGLVAVGAGLYFWHAKTYDQGFLDGHIAGLREGRETSDAYYEHLEAQSERERTRNIDIQSRIAFLRETHATCEAVIEAFQDEYREEVSEEMESDLGDRCYEYMSNSYDPGMDERLHDRW